MSQIRIAKYNYNKYGSFQVIDTYGEPCFLVFEEFKSENIRGDKQEEWVPIEVVQEY